MKRLNGYSKENFFYAGLANNFNNTKFVFPSFRFSEKNDKNDENKPNACRTNQKLDLHEYNGKEFSKTKEDATDKTKPFDNLFTKISRPDLDEQYEKRKDIFHTLDTPYVQKEENKIKVDEQKENKKQ